MQMTVSEEENRLVFFLALSQIKPFLRVQLQTKNLHIFDWKIIYISQGKELHNVKNTNGYRHQVIAKKTLGESRSLSNLVYYSQAETPPEPFKLKWTKI